MGFTISDEVLKTLTIEKLYENAKNFNKKSGGGISLITKRHDGDFLEEFFLSYSNMVGFRDPYSDSDATFTTLSTSNQLSPKIPYKAKVSFRVSDIKRYGGDEKTLLSEIATAIGDQVTKHMLDNALVCFNAAVNSNSSMVIDKSCESADLYNDLTNLLAKFGDFSNELVSFVMHSASFYKIMQKGLTLNSDTVISGILYNATPASLGRTVYAVDNSTLTSTKDCSGTTTTIYDIFALKRGGITILESEIPEYLVEKKGSGENIVYQVSAEGSYTVKIAGYKYKKTTDEYVKDSSGISSSTKWQKVATSDKATAGAILIHQ